MKFYLFLKSIIRSFFDPLFEKIYNQEKKVALKIFFVGHL